VAAKEDHVKRYTKLIVPLIALVAAAIAAAPASAAVPANTAPPTITGTPEKGMTLTAHNGTWTGNPTTFFYRWQRCAADGTGCGNISGASTKRYALTSADVDHTVRVRVTASNADGQGAAFSKTSDLVSDSQAPQMTTRPTVSGTPRPGDELTAANGTWTGGATTFTYQWQRCDASGAGCVDVAGATGKTYGVRAADLGHTMRVAVTAKNLAGSTTMNSDVTAVVRSAATPAPAPTPAPAANHRPVITILGVRWAGHRIYVRFRVCDDSRRNVSILERDSKPHVRSYARNFRTLVAPRNCAALTRSWIPAPRFRHGRFTVTLTARDAFRLTSLRPARRSFFR
jgi:hypothetical protein